MEIIIFVAQFIFYKKTLNGDYGPLGTSAYFFDEENEEEDESRIKNAKEGIIVEVRGEKTFEAEIEMVGISKPVLY